MKTFAEFLQEAETFETVPKTRGNDRATRRAALEKHAQHRADQAGYSLGRSVGRAQANRFHDWNAGRKHEPTSQANAKHRVLKVPSKPKKRSWFDRLRGR